MSRRKPKRKYTKLEKTISDQEFVKAMGKKRRDVELYTQFTRKEVEQAMIESPNWPNSLDEIMKDRDACVVLCNIPDGNDECDITNDENGNVKLRWKKDGCPVLANMTAADMDPIHEDETVDEEAKEFES